MDELQAVPPELEHAAPDWESGGQPDLFCPLCHYNLRGLREPRCPECGYKFQWADLTDPARRVHPYLFEHHSERNVWSFWKTAVGGLRPVRFWKRLTPAQPSRPRRLMLYWVLTTVVALAGAVGPYAAGWISWERDRQTQLAAFAATNAAWARGGRFGGYVVPYVPPSADAETIWRAVGPGYAVWWAWCVVWPWLTILTLMVFRISMRRAKVRPIHVCRCVLYSADAIIWGGVGLLGLSVFAAWGNLLGNHDRLLAPLTGTWLACVALFIVARLGIAYSSYLRFQHAWATVITSQVIVGLIALILLVQWSLYHGPY